MRSIVICTAHKTLFTNNVLGGACSMYGKEEKFIQGFGGETGGKETTWET
jgi:hypothetical protein